MISGIVYFSEIVELIGDLTGIENLEPLYPKLRRFILLAEKDISASGLIVRKEKTYTLGDGSYDGTYLKLPQDFIGEYSYADLDTVEFRGDKLQIIYDDLKNVETIDLSYMGILLDSEGNPITTHNHLQAVVNFCMWRLYTPLAFLNKREGSMQKLDYWKREYEDECMSARANDAWPTEKQWEEIGQTLRQPFSAAVTDCGLKYIDYGSTSTQPIDGGAGGGSCGDLTIDMVSIYNTAKG